MDLKALLLDLDGTLVDTAPDMVGSLNRVLKKHGKTSCNYERAHQLVSNGGRALIEFGFGESLREFDADALLQEFLDDYEEHVCDDSIIYEGMSEVLEFCQNNFLKWGVITNKPIELAKGVLDGLDLLDRCAILLGGDSLPVKKPDPVPLLHTCMVLHLAPSQCVYIGDHERDIQAANAAGMDSAVAMWGYLNDQQTPDQWNAKALVTEPLGLIKLLKDRL